MSPRLEAMLLAEAERLLRQRRIALGQIAPSSTTVDALRDSVKQVLAKTSPERAAQLEATPDEIVVRAFASGIAGIFTPLCGPNWLRIDALMAQVGRA